MVSSLCCAIACACLTILAAIASPLPSSEMITRSLPSPTARDFLHLGAMEAQQGNYEQALADFTQAIELDGQLAAAYSDRCLVRLHLEAYASAREDCTQSLTQQPENIEAYLNRGLAAHHLGDYEDAIADYTAASQLQPQDLRPYYNRGLVYVDRAQYDRAIADYNQALHQSLASDLTALAQIYNERGLAKAKAGDVTEAIADFSRSLHFNAHNPNAYYNLAWSCQQQGNYSCALENFTASLERQPDFAQAYIHRGLLRDRLGQHQGAIEDLRHGADCFCQQGQMKDSKKIEGLILKIRQNTASFDPAIA